MARYENPGEMGKMVMRTIYHHSISFEIFQENKIRKTEKTAYTHTKPKT